MVAESSSGDIRDAVLAMMDRGWSPIPVKRGSKAPVGTAWQNQRLKHGDIARFGATDNVGVLLGEPSGWLVDIDLDTPEAIALAPSFLPPTGDVFGRSTKPRSHWLYVADGSGLKRFKGPDGATLLELRSTGMQTIFPGSVHPSGEAIRWDDHTGTATVAAASLAQSVARLAVATLFMRAGLDEASARHLASDDTALVMMPGEQGKLAREWLGLSTSAPIPASPGRAGADFAEAVRSYNQAHARKWPKSCGECPMCGHKGCFNAIPGAPDRWYCWSAGHSGGGQQGGGGWYGDALDVDAHAAGLKASELLKREGYLTKRSYLRPVPSGDGNGGDAGAPRGRETREIVIDADVERLTDQALEALDESESEVYHRGGLLVQEIADEHAGKSIGSRRLAPIAPARLLELMSSSAKWMKLETRGKKGEDGEREMKPTWPPDKIVSAVIGRGRWPMLRRVAAIVETPMFRPDGSILDEPGYDEVTGLLYRPNAVVEVPKNPTHADAISARDELLDVVHDFPFASEAYKSSWLACALTPLARYGFEGPSPLFLVDANTRGSGKSMLADVVGSIACGKTLPRTPPAEDEAEERKRITALALSGDRLVLIDNVKRLGSAALDAVLTSTWWRDRVLGEGKVFEGEIKAVFIATGNNVELLGDLTRRVCHIRLESMHERPEQRSDFKHPDLLPWVRAEAPRLAKAALTILRAYHVAGRPAQKVQPWGSYEGWNRLVSHALVWVGMADPNEARQELVEAADTERLSLASFLSEFRKYATWGATARDLVDDIETAPSSHAKVRDALYELVPPYKGKPPSALQVGKKFSAVKGRVAGGMRLVSDIGPDGVSKWSVRDA